MGGVPLGTHWLAEADTQDVVGTYVFMFLAEWFCVHGLVCKVEAAGQHSLFCLLPRLHALAFPVAHHCALHPTLLFYSFL